MLNITLIGAVDRKMAIGKGGDIPWRGCLKADMDHFKHVTLEATVVMGRKTYESLPARFRPLPDRKNIIITRNADFSAPGCFTFQTIDPVFHEASVEVFIIGGGEIYKLFMPHANRLLLTHVETKIDGDTFFPRIPTGWKERLVSDHPKDEGNHFPFAIVEYTHR